MNFHSGRLVVTEFMYPTTRNTIYDDYLPTTAKAATEEYNFTKTFIQL